MIVDYLVLVFLNCTGALQIAAARSHLRGLLLLQKPSLSILLGLGLGILGFAWFFRSGPLHIPDTAGGLAGFQQFGLFSLGAVTALSFTLVATSLLYHRSLPLSIGQTEGLDLLKNTTLSQIFLRKWRNH